METVKKTERGWAGHFICAYRCKFTRNTLLEFGDVKIVVSTVGLMRNMADDSFEEVGCGRYFETMAFFSDSEDDRYHDIDVSRPVSFDSDGWIDEIDADDLANNMHENIVDEISEKLKAGNIY